VRSRRVDGYTVDRGFQVLFTAYPTLGRALGLDGATRGAGDGDAAAGTAARGTAAGGGGPLRLRPFAPAARVVTDGGASLVGDALRDPRAARRHRARRRPHPRPTSCGCSPSDGSPGRSAWTRASPPRSTRCRPRSSCGRAA
jgi:hypothetical protein